MKAKYNILALICISVVVMSIQAGEALIELNTQTQTLHEQGHYQAAIILTTLIDRMSDLQKTKQQFFAISGEHYEPTSFLVFKIERYPHDFQVPIISFENDICYYMADDRFSDFVLYIVNKLLAFTSKNNRDYWQIIEMLHTMTKKVIEAIEVFENKIKEFQAKPWWKKLF